MSIVLDIETLCTNDPAVIAEIAAGIVHPKTMTKPDTIAKWEAEDKPALVDEAVRKTSFDATYGKIVCVGWAIDNDPVKAICSEAERALIETFFAAVKNTEGLYQHTFIGHNVSGFDLRFLWQRSVILGIRPPSSIPFAAKPWDKSIADTMLMWHPDRERRISLDRLCKALGVLSSKNDMDGSMVADAFKRGEHERIAEYCAADVTATRECYRKMVFA